jgi:trans-L-3-hydroxyproline dehydratase
VSLLLGQNGGAPVAGGLAHRGRLLGDDGVHGGARGWDHISFCQFAGPLAEDADGALAGANAIAVRPGKIDRSPTGTGCSARMAVLHAKGRTAVGGRYRARSIIGSDFDCSIAAETAVEARPGIIPTVAGRAWITGTSQLMLDPDDPWPTGYRLSDTWPRMILL